MEMTSAMLLLIIPLALIQLGLQIGALVSLAKRQKVRFDNKLVWALIILLGGTVGSIVYFVAGGDGE